MRGIINAEVIKSRSPCKKERQQLVANNLASVISEINHSPPRGRDGTGGLAQTQRPRGNRGPDVGATNLKEIIR